MKLYTVSMGSDQTDKNGTRYVSLALRDSASQLITKWYFVESNEADRIHDEFEDRVDEVDGDKQARGLFMAFVGKARREGFVLAG